MSESKGKAGKRASGAGHRLRSGRRRCAVASLLGVVIAGVLACAPRLAIETEVVEPPADFEVLRSFSIVPTEDQNGNVERVIADEIKSALVEKGLAPVDMDTADMLVSYRASAVDLTKSVLDGDPDANFYRIVEYVEGTLVIDVFSRVEARRIWHGQAVLDDRDRKELMKRKAAAVAEVLARFPAGG